MEAGTLRCPGCGAPAATGRDGMRVLQDRAGPDRVPHLLRDGAGGEPALRRVRRARGEKRAGGGAPPLPRLQRGDAGRGGGETRIHECPDCQGAWLDGPGFDRVCADAETGAAVLPHLGTPAAAAGPARAATVRYLPCPACGELMNRSNFARISGVVLDRCPKHGVWLDRGELARVVEFVRAGGMDRAGARERLRREEERRRLEAVRTSTPTSSRRRDRGGRGGLEVGREEALRGAIAGWMGLR